LNTEGIAGLLTSQGIDVSRVMEGRGGSADWLPEDAALACAGLPMRAEYAFRFRYAMADACKSTFNAKLEGVQGDLDGQRVGAGKFGPQSELWAHWPEAQK